MEDGVAGGRCGRLDGESDPAPLVAAPPAESDPVVSPDGRWLACASDESGREEVYVSPFPNASDSRWPVSSEGGFSPQWAHGGGELFFKTPTGQLTGVQVNKGDTFELGKRKVLISVSNLWKWKSLNAYSVSPDNQRFLIIQDRGNPENSALIVGEGFHRVLDEITGD